MRCDKPTGADPEAVAVQQLATTGVSLMGSVGVMRSLGVDRDEWTRFARHWEDLAPDPYAAELGIQRLRRYGRYLLRDGRRQPMPAESFVQPENSNPLYIDRDRHFEPLTDAFADDPLLRRLLQVLRRVADSLDAVAEWNVKVHPFRIEAPAHGDGRPTPEGLHRDGVTLVSSLLVGRRNAIGGESTVCDLSGHTLATTTLEEPGTLLLGDDRRTQHGVSPIRPIDGSGPAVRDVLVITFASR
ncbi:hypothetical protein A5791_08200 [Mycobacterium sp. 852002-51163_SCH5372311]|nr:hypothetical protein A5791_08200 [Mycobacterium sp. 852002-51163_SCH5372311]